MLAAQRKQKILEKLKLEGQVFVTQLSLEWEVSEDTIRRDLGDLAQDGLVQRVHGGALPSSAATGTYQVRESIAAESKILLGKKGATLVRSGQIIAIDGGTTNLQLARALPLDLRCTAVTHSPLVAAELGRRPHIEIILIGGKIFHHSQVAVGAEAVEAIGRIRTDLFFLGVTGIHPETGATTGDWEDAAVKRAFCQASAETVILGSEEKIGAASAFQIVAPREIATLVVPPSTADSLVEPFRKGGIQVLRSEGQL